MHPRFYIVCCSYQIKGISLCIDYWFPYVVKLIRIQIKKPLLSPTELLLCVISLWGHTLTDPCLPDMYFPSCHIFVRLAVPARIAECPTDIKWWGDSSKAWASQRVQPQQWERWSCARMAGSAGAAPRPAHRKYKAGLAAWKGQQVGRGVRWPADLSHCNHLRRTCEVSDQCLFIPPPPTHFFLFQSQMSKQNPLCQLMCCSVLFEGWGELMLSLLSCGSSSWASTWLRATWPTPRAGWTRPSSLPPPSAAWSAAPRPWQRANHWAREERDIAGQNPSSDVQITFEVWDSVLIRTSVKRNLLCIHVP